VDQPLINLRASIVQSSRLALSLFAGTGIAGALAAYVVDDSTVRFLAGVVVGASYMAFTDTRRSTKRTLAAMDQFR
jgi:uncharacterized membrane protein (UPF0136 family)